MSENSLVKPGGTASETALVPVRIDTSNLGLVELANALARSGYFKDASDPAKAIVKVLYGQELGIPPISAMMGIHIIEGKPAPSANLLASIIKRSRVYDYRVLERSNTRAAIVFFEQGQKLGVSEWTIEDAARAGLVNKDNWKKYPRAMLFSRCMTEGIRTYCPDLFGGAPVYTPEELGAEVTEDGQPIVEVAYQRHADPGEAREQPASPRGQRAAKCQECKASKGHSPTCSIGKAQAPAATSKPATAPPADPPEGEQKANYQAPEVPQRSTTLQGAYEDMCHAYADAGGDPGDTNQLRRHVEAVLTRMHGQPTRIDTLEDLLIDEIQEASKHFYEEGLPHLDPFIDES